MNAHDDHDRPELSAFLDGQLSPTEAEALADELQRDPKLRAELEQLEATRKLLRDLPTETAPASMLETVMEQIERERLLHAAPVVEKGASMVWMRRLATAAIIVLTAGLGFWLHNELSSDDWVRQQEQNGNTPLARSIDLGEDKDTITGDAPSDAADADVLAKRFAPAEPASETIVAKGVVRPERELSIGGPVLPKLAPAAPPEIATLSAGRDDRGLTRRKAGLAEIVGRSNIKAGVGGGMAGSVDRMRVGQMAIEEVRTVTLNTTDLEATNRSVAQVLLCNGIQPISDTPARRPKAAPSSGARRSRGNFSYRGRQGPDGSTIVFYVDQAQARSVEAQLAAIDTGLPTSTRLARLSEQDARRPSTLMIEEHASPGPVNDVADAEELQFINEIVNVLRRDAVEPTPADDICAEAPVVDQTLNVSEGSSEQECRATLRECERAFPAAPTPTPQPAPSPNMFGTQWRSAGRSRQRLEDPQQQAAPAMGRLTRMEVTVNVAPMASQPAASLPAATTQPAE